MKTAAIWILCLMLFLAGTAGAETPAKTPSETPLKTDQEGRDMHRVFYEIFVGSFSDSDGDGIGDLRGIINRLDYLNDGNPASEKSLGVEGIWLTPVFASPSYHKYDAADYDMIDPAFGTTDDLKELIRLCHERDMLVILDLALNHTSKQHPWYQGFLNAHASGDSENPQYNWYLWIDQDEKTPAGRLFIQEDEAGLQVEANFSENMPELDFDQEAVRQATLDVAKTYLALGVDGFRFDAAKYIYLGDHDKNIAFWSWYIGELKKIKPDVYTVAEVWDGEGVANRYEACMNCFRFSTSQAEGAIANAARGGNVNRWALSMQNYLDTIHEANPDAMSILFLSNHDMDRAAGYLPVSGGKAQMAANLYLLAPGSPFIYYGEEIGMKGSRGSENTDASRRLAMLWGDGDTVQDPAGSTYENQSPYMVRDLDGMQDSILNHYRKVIRARREHPEIARGSFTALQFDGTKAGGYLCTLAGSMVGVFHNTTNKPQELNLNGTEAAGLSQVDTVLAANPEKGGAGLKEGILTLGPQTSAILK